MVEQQHRWQQRCWCWCWCWFMHSLWMITRPKQAVCTPSNSRNSRYRTTEQRNMSMHSCHDPPPTLHRLTDVDVTLDFRTAGTVGYGGCPSGECCAALTARDTVLHVCSEPEPTHGCSRIIRPLALRWFGWRKGGDTRPAIHCLTHKLANCNCGAESLGPAGCVCLTSLPDPEP